MLPRSFLTTFVWMTKKLEEIKKHQVLFKKDLGVFSIQLVKFLGAQGP